MLLFGTLSGTTKEGVMSKWFYSELKPGDGLKVRFDEFPVETLGTPVKTF
jgi:hypothetical protein